MTAEDREGRGQIEDADPDDRDVTTVLEGIPEAYERAQLGLAQARRGETIPLESL